MLLAPIVVSTTHPSDCESGNSYWNDTVLWLRAMWPQQIGMPSRTTPLRSMSPDAISPRKFYLQAASSDPYLFSLAAVQQQQFRSGQTREQEYTKPSASRPSAPNKPNSSFKRDGIAVIHELPPPDKLLLHGESPAQDESPLHDGSPVQVIDPVLPAMTEKFTPGTPRMQLFFRTWSSKDSANVNNGRLCLGAKPHRRCRLQPTPLRTPNSRPRRRASNRRKWRGHRLQGLCGTACHSARFSYGTSSQLCPIFYSRC